MQIIYHATNVRDRCAAFVQVRPDRNRNIFFFFFFFYLISNSIIETHEIRNISEPFIFIAITLRFVLLKPIDLIVIEITIDNLIIHTERGYYIICFFSDI